MTDGGGGGGTQFTGGPGGGPTNLTVQVNCGRRGVYLLGGAGGVRSGSNWRNASSFVANPWGGGGWAFDKGGGGGGGGYYGGGGGACAESSTDSGGGGGGSSYVGTATDTTNSQGLPTAGNPGNTTDSYYNGTAGVGASSGNGAPGLVVVTWY